MDITKLTGEEIAKHLSEQYQLLIQAQQNLVALNSELKRREAEKPKSEPKEK